MEENVTDNDILLAHEAMDRASRLINYVEDDLLAHEWARKDPAFKASAEKAIEGLCAAYQSAGVAAFQEQ